MNRGQSKASTPTTPEEEVETNSEVEVLTNEAKRLAYLVGLVDVMPGEAPEV
jgi:hypothetical protein